MDFNFQYTRGGTPPPAQTLTVDCVDQETLATSYPNNASFDEQAEWLALTPATGATPLAIQLSVNPSGLQAGTYLEQVRLRTTTTPVENPDLSFSVQLTVIDPTDRTPPTVRITKPTDGSTFRTNSIALTVSGSDDVGVVRGELWVDDKLCATQVEAPLPTTFNLDWQAKAIPKGSHLFEVRVYDAADNTAKAQIHLTRN